MNLHKQNFVCWPSVGPQDIKQTYIHTCIARGTRQLPILQLCERQVSIRPRTEAANDPRLSWIKLLSYAASAYGLG